MRARILVAALGIVALAALALGRAPTTRPPAPTGRVAATPPADERSGAPRVVDPEAIRDLFRFADASGRSPDERGRERGGARAVLPSATAPAPPGPRLVGIVSRGGRTVAALAAEGEVLLAGPGETAAGVTVLAVDGDGVRIRRPDGTEAVLQLQ